MKFLKPVCFLVFFIVFAGIVYGQKNVKIIPEKCGTMQNLELQWQANPQLKQQFEEERNRFNKAVREGTFRLSANGNRAFITVPVVFHVVVNNQAQVTDAQILAQLDTLNKDYAGINGDSVKVPAWIPVV